MKRNGEVFYPNLEGQIAERGIKRTVISAVLGISPRALTNKLSGKFVIH